MRHSSFALAAGALAAGMAWTAALAEDEATPQEIIDKVNDAAAYLATEGEAGLALFDDADSDFVWKDSYVFVWDCAADKVVAHPVAASRDKFISSLTDITGTALGPLMCDAAARPDGSWAEYQWPKPVKVEGSRDLAYTGDPARKVSFMLSVPGQPWQVGAGIYDDNLSLDQLDALAK